MPCNTKDPIEHLGPHTEDCFWGPARWNDHEQHFGQKTTWNASLCDWCWSDTNPDRLPVRALPPEAEVCTRCGDATRSGIYVRQNPDEQIYKRWVSEG